MNKISKILTEIMDLFVLVFLSQFDQTIDKIVPFHIRFDSFVDHVPKSISEKIGRFSEKFYRQIFRQIRGEEY